MLIKNRDFLYIVMRQQPAELLRLKVGQQLQCENCNCQNLGDSKPKGNPEMGSCEWLRKPLKP